MANETRLILQELKGIKQDLDHIKDHMVDVDTIMTSEEEERFEESMQDMKDGKTTSLEEFEKEMRDKDA